MFKFNQQDGLRPKCYFTTSTLPAFVDHDQLPRKKKPFSTVLGQTFNSELNVLIPTNAAETLEKSLAKEMGICRYQTVYMKLNDLIEGDFFNHYIKSGNILMLSEGRLGVDQVYSLAEGVLRLNVDKPTYERLGLEGKAIPSEGRKHVKARFAIELNLRLPSMIRGKSGFQRIVWAFQHVLNRSLKWLFYDLKGPNDGTGPISIHQPRLKEVHPEKDIVDAAHVPPFLNDLGNDSVEDAVELLEWLSLAISQSRRIRQNDSIDPYLSRYAVASSDGVCDESKSVQALICLRWQGFLSPIFMQTTLLATLKAASSSWFAFGGTSFDGKAYTFLQDGDRTMTWEYHD